VRKQTLVNEERYITTELKEKENIILTAVDELNKLEYEIFSDLRRQVAEFSPEIRVVPTKAAALDVLAGLAEIAV
jgi:DNA mismatch repair protein MutS